MDNDVRIALSWSNQAFVNLVWPELKQHIGGRIFAVEVDYDPDGEDEDLMKLLDVKAGIDAWHIVNGNYVGGIASRVQVCPNNVAPYDTFTVRRAMHPGEYREYEKRLGAIRADNGLLYPYLTVQAYISARYGGELRSWSYIETKRLIEYIAANEAEILVREREGPAQFYVVPWSDVGCATYTPVPRFF